MLESGQAETAGKRLWGMGMCAAVGFTKTLAMESGLLGIRVNTILQAVVERIGSAM